jgi:hypothetical protein
MDDKDFDISELLEQVQNESLYELYNDYIYQEVMKIPLLNIWDMCAVAARDMFYNRSVPACIKNFDKEALKKIKHTDKDTIALLIPIQKWMSEQIIKSITEKEVIPQIIGRSVEGKIDAKRTYIDLEQFHNWQYCRNLNSKPDLEDYEDDDELLDKYICTSVNSLKESFKAQASLLRAKIYLREFKNPKISNTRMESANTEIRMALDKTSQKTTPITKEPNKHSERHATNREQILGAALSVVTKFTVNCQNKEGKFEATKIAHMIDEKSYLYWQETGIPPLSLSKMERIISDWLKKVA